MVLRSNPHARLASEETGGASVAATQPYGAGQLAAAARRQLATATRSALTHRALDGQRTPPPLRPQPPLARAANRLALPITSLTRRLGCPRALQGIQVRWGDTIAPLQPSALGLVDVGSLRHHLAEEHGLQPAQLRLQCGSRELLDDGESLSAVDTMVRATERGGLLGGAPKSRKQPLSPSLAQNGGSTAFQTVQPSKRRKTSAPVVPPAPPAPPAPPPPPDPAVVAPPPPPEPQAEAPDYATEALMAAIGHSGSKAKAVDLHMPR